MSRPSPDGRTPPARQDDGVTETSQPNGPLQIPGPVRVLIVDDDRRVRQSLSGLMDLREGIEIVGTAADGEACIALCGAVAPDTVLLDLKLPEVTDGLGLLAELRRRWPAIHVVAMSVQVSLRSAAIAAGAVAFIPKGGQPEAICDALVRTRNAARA
jgi:DNA-binding NarL/FixJ family response regulator